MIGDDIKVTDTLSRIREEYKQKNCVGCPFIEIAQVCDKSECRWEQLCEVLRGW